MKSYVISLLLFVIFCFTALTENESNDEPKMSPKEIIHKKDSSEMILIPAGEVIIGITKGFAEKVQ